MYWSDYNTEFSVANILIQLYTAIFKWILYYWPWRWPYWVETYFMFCWTTSLCSLFQMKPNRCTLLLSIFISATLHVSGNYVPIVRRTYCIYATLVFFTLCGWLSGLLVGMSLSSQPADQCRIDTVNSPDDGHIIARNMYRSCFRASLSLAILLQLWILIFPRSSLTSLRRVIPVVLIKLQCIEYV